jgi:hypothetical protein
MLWRVGQISEELAKEHQFYRVKFFSVKAFWEEKWKNIKQWESFI